MHCNTERQTKKNKNKKNGNKLFPFIAILISIKRDRTGKKNEIKRDRVQKRER